MSLRFVPAAGAAPSAPIVSESIVSRRLPMRGSTECPSEPVAMVGEPGELYPPGLLPVSEGWVWPPERVVDGFRADAVVLPHPRYPDESSAMPATAGSVGSLLGLKPYSSTSFRRASSAFLRCFLLLHKKMPPSTNNATTTTGITTAIAVLPPADRPPLFESFPD